MDPALKKSNAERSKQLRADKKKRDPVKFKADEKARKHDSRIRTLAALSQTQREQRTADSTMRVSMIFIKFGLCCTFHIDSSFHKQNNK